jgi:hypothetical protein
VDAAFGWRTYWLSDEGRAQLQRRVKSVEAAGRTSGGLGAVDGMEGAEVKRLGTH